MTWSLYRWVWQLESPLHIGMPPAGILSRTRLYVPARALWGALTAEMARRQSSSLLDYQAMGERLQKQTRLSYLFPAEKVGEEWLAWLPEYREEKGLMWIREDGSRSKEDRIFRRWLLAARSGTAIAPDSDTAQEGSLREHEVLNAFSYWDDEAPSRREVPSPRSVGLVGYVFLADGADKELLEIERIFIGGDTRYGLGRLKRVIELTPSSKFFGEAVDLAVSDPVVTTSRVLAHTVARAPFCGAMEHLAGWDIISSGLKQLALTWVPGSKSMDENGDDKQANFSIQGDGLWREKA